MKVCNVRSRPSAAPRVSFWSVLGGWWLCQGRLHSHLRRILERVVAKCFETGQTGVAEIVPLVAEGQPICHVPPVTSSVGSMPMRSLTASRSFCLHPRWRSVALDGDVPKQELNLIQLAAGQVAKPRAGASQIVRCELLDSCTRGALSYDLPQNLRSHSYAPGFTSLVDRSKERSFGDTAGLLPCVNRRLDPRWNGNGTDVSSLAEEVGDDPMLLS